MLTAILDHLPLGVWVARAPSGEVAYANAAFRSILGMDAVEGVTIQGAPATYGITDQAGNSYPVEQLPFSRVLATGGPVVVDDLVIDRGAKGKVNVRAFAAPLRDGAGALTHVIVAFIDITAEVGAISGRKQVEEQLSFAVHHAPVILWSTDRHGIITLSEGSALGRMDLKSGQLVGQSLPELYRDHPIILADFRRALGGEEVRHTVQLADLTFETTMTPVRDARGEVTGVIGMSTDVSERSRLQARIIQNDRVTALGTLAASVAHEINNPLTYLLLELGAADDQVVRAGHAVGETDGRSATEALARARASLAEARTGAERIWQIARELHTFARPAGEEIRAVSLAGVIRSVLQLVRKELEARAHLTVDLGDTPPVRGDESRLVQVVLNLLVNAWQALPEGDPARHRIAIRTREDGPHVIIEVSDSGRGVPPENRERIFDPFFTTKEVGAGTGLGLFVCRNIVQGFGGQIEVGDAPDGGALFRVRLPVATVAIPVEESPPVAAPPVRKGRVLIIDDDERVARILAQSLAAEFEVQAVLDGQEALELLVTDRGVDLVYCDLMMRGLTGMELHEALGRRAPERLPKLVFMTGGAFTAQASAFVQRMAGSVVYKPFDILAETRLRLAR